MRNVLYIPEKALLIILTVFVSVTTILSGLLMMVEPGATLANIPIQLFDPHEFHDYFVPGFLFSMMAGNANLVALIYIIEKDDRQFSVAIGGSIMVLAWVVSHMYMTEQFHWLQLLYIMVGSLMLFLSVNLKGGNKKDRLKH